MDLIEAIRTRKSVRAFTDTPVEDSVFRRIMEAARLAPSARNGQEWRFVAVRDKAIRQKIAAEAARQPFIGEAPILLACCAETDERLMRCGQAAYPIDVAIAMDHLSLAAAAEGLGTCWIGSFDEGVVKRILEIPDSVRVVELMPLGYPVDPSAVLKNRLPLEEILRMDRWQ